MWGEPCQFAIVCRGTVEVVTVLSPPCQIQGEIGIVGSWTGDRGFHEALSSPNQLPMEAWRSPLSSRSKRTRISCHATLDKAACAPFCKGKAHELHQRHQHQREIRGSAVEGSAVQRPRHGNVLQLRAIGVSAPTPLSSGTSVARRIIGVRTPGASQSLISGVNPANKFLLVSDSEQQSGQLVALLPAKSGE
jgi:hypothetical protein